jgi:hypothetical protein
MRQFFSEKLNPSYERLLALSDIEGLDSLPVRVPQAAKKRVPEICDRKPLKFSVSDERKLAIARNRYKRPIENKGEILGRNDQIASAPCLPRTFQGP